MLLYGEVVFPFERDRLKKLSLIICNYKIAIYPVIWIENRYNIFDQILPLLINRTELTSHQRAVTITKDNCRHSIDR